MKQSELNARASIAGDLFREGRITRPECFRLEMDAALGRDTGSAQFETNTEYAELVHLGVFPNAPEQRLVASTLPPVIGGKDER